LGAVRGWGEFNRWGEAAGAGRFMCLAHDGNIGKGRWGKREERSFLTNAYKRKQDYQEQGIVDP